MRDHLTRKEMRLLIDWGDALKNRDSVTDLDTIMSQSEQEWYGDVIEIAYSKAFFIKNKINGAITLGVDAEEILNFADDYDEAIARFESVGWNVSDER